MAGHTHIVQLLVSHGADVHALDRLGSHALHKAIRNGHLDVAQLLFSAGSKLQNQESERELFDCAAKGDLEKMKSLIAHGVDVNTVDNDLRTPLREYSSMGGQAFFHCFLFYLL